MREENVELRQKLDGYEPKIKSLQENEQKLQEAETQLTEAVIARTAVEAAKDNTLAEKVAAEAEVDRLNKKNKELFDQVTSLKNDLSVVERDRDKFKERSKLATSKALSLARYQFDNAVSQIQLIHPNLEIDKSIVHADHCVAGQEIVRPQKKEGNVFHERAVIFKAGPSS